MVTLVCAAPIIIYRVFDVFVLVQPLVRVVNIFLTLSGPGFFRGAWARWEGGGGGGKSPRAITPKGNLKGNLIGQ